MKNIKEKAIDDLLGVEEEDEKEIKKHQIIKEKSGLVERVDKIYVTNDGRQLLREQY